MRLQCDSTRYSSGFLITRVSISWSASSRSNYSNARLYRPGGGWSSYSSVPGSWSSRGLGLGRKHYSRLKPEGEVNWELGGTTGRFWTAVQRRRHQMAGWAGWVAHGMGYRDIAVAASFQGSPRPRACRLPARGDEKRLQSMTFATYPGRREHRGSGFPHDTDWAESTPRTL